MSFAVASVEGDPVGFPNSRKYPFGSLAARYVSSRNPRSSLSATKHSRKSTPQCVVLVNRNGRVLQILPLHLDLMRGRENGPQRPVRRQGQLQCEPLNYRAKRVSGVANSTTDIPCKPRDDTSIVTDN